MAAFSCHALAVGSSPEYVSLYFKIFFQWFQWLTVTTSARLTRRPL